MAVRGPPGGVGDEGRLTLAPVAAPSGEEARGEDIILFIRKDRRERRPSRRTAAGLIEMDTGRWTTRDDGNGRGVSLSVTGPDRRSYLLAQLAAGP